MFAVIRENRDRSITRLLTCGSHYKTEQRSAQWPWTTAGMWKSYCEK